MKRNSLLLGVIAVALVGLAAAAWFVFAGNDTTVAATAVVNGQTRDGFTITPYDRAMGLPKASMLVVEYAAPTCPYCARFFTTVFPSFKKDWVDTGKAYFVFRVFPLSAVDIAAESMARCLPKERYFPFIDLLYRNQDKWDPDGHDIPDVHGALVKMGQIAGMSAGQVDACIGDQAAAKRIGDLGQKASTDYLIDHTPTIFANGQMVQAIGNYRDFNDALKTIAAKK